MKVSPATYLLRGVFLRLLAASLFFGHFLGTAAAFDFVPIKATFAPAGEGATKNFRIVNTGNAPIAVEIRFLRIEKGIDGEETRTPAEEDFLAFPPQTVILPRQTQTIRVQWLGPVHIDAELAYRIIAEQLPVNLTEAQAGNAQIRMLLKYEGLIYVRPEGAAPDIVVGGVEAVTQAEDTAPKLALTLRNRGAAHATIVEPTLTLTAAEGGEVQLTGEALSSLSDGSILALSERTYTLPWPQGLPVGPLTAHLTFEIED